MDKEKITRAIEIAEKVKEYAEEIVKPNIPLLDIAEKIEKKISSFDGAKPAFPVNLCINEVAAHCTPSYRDKTPASGLIKVDFGVSVDGWVADWAFPKDLANSELNKNLIATSGAALVAAENIGLKPGVSTNEIGTAISKAIENRGFVPIVNLSGHSIERHNLHAGVTIPNINDERDTKLKEGLYAIEPFVTESGAAGRVRDGKPSGIYSLQDSKKPRSQLAREALSFIESEYKTLPFCSRWLIEKLGPNSALALRELESQGIIHQYNQLVEASGAIVSQNEKTFLIKKD